MTVRQAGVLLLRLLVTAGFLALALLLVDVRTVADQIRRSDLRLVGLMVLVLPVAFVALAWRWRLLLDANGFAIPFRRVLAVTWAGAFFNLVLPGAAGGDLARAVLAAKGEERKAALVGTILLDRVLGLATMILVASVATLPVLGRAELRPVVWTVGALLGGMVLGLLVYFSPLGATIRRVLPFRGVVEELHRVMTTMRDARGVVAASVLLSLVAQSVTIFAIVGLARAMGLAAIPVSAFFLVEPIIFIVTAVPVSIGGWGVQEMAYMLLFQPYGVVRDASGALSLLYKFALLAAGIPGGIWFAAGGTRRS